MAPFTFSAMKRILSPGFIWSNQATLETLSNMVIAGIFRLVSGPCDKVTLPAVLSTFLTRGSIICISAAGAAMAWPAWAPPALAGTAQSEGKAIRGGEGREARRRMQRGERRAKVTLAARLLGGPRPLTDAQVVSLLAGAAASGPSSR